MQVSLVPPAPVLPPGVTTPLEVRYRPLLVGSSEAVLALDSTELGLYEWRLKLTGAPTIPERPLTFSVPLGARETQVRARAVGVVKHAQGSASTGPRWPLAAMQQMTGRSHQSLPRPLRSCCASRTGCPSGPSIAAASRAEQAAAAAVAWPAVAPALMRPRLSLPRLLALPARSAAPAWTWSSVSALSPALWARPCATCWC